MTHWVFIPSTVSTTVGATLSKNTTTEAILMTLIAVRDKSLTIDDANNVNKLFVYGSNQTHSTFVKVYDFDHDNCSIDPVVPLTLVAKGHEIWVHVDAAYAENVCICPEFDVT
ncbi:hypothetical protein GQ457_01G007020 [Hibiscus cannabinus]